METRASHLLVGSFVLLMVAGLTVFVVWLAKFQFDEQFTRYDIFFTGSVTGLKAGSVVRFSGVRVGEVIFVGLDHENPERVRALVELEAATPVRRDTVASLEVAGLTGGRYVMLSGGSPGSSPLRAEEGQKRPVIASRRSSLQMVLEGAPELLDSVNLLLARANDLVSAENSANFATSLDNLTRLSGALAARSGDIESLIADAAGTMRNLREASGAIEEMAENLKADGARLTARADTMLAAVERLARSVDGSVTEASGEVTTLVRELRTSAKSFTAMTKELQTLVAENRGPLQSFTTGGLYELATLITEARELLVGLNRVTTAVERDPARFLFGDQQQGYEAGQP